MSVRVELVNESSKSNRHVNPHSQSTTSSNFLTSFEKIHNGLKFWKFNEEITVIRH